MKNSHVKGEKLASIDIGTNTVRLLIGTFTDDGILERVQGENRITRLGEGFIHTGRLLEVPMARTVEVLKDYVEKAEMKGVTAVIAVATSVAREASNRKVFQERVQKEVGIALNIINGEEEGRLTALGVSHLFGDMEKVILDIGGGSTEIVIVRHDGREGISLPLGVVHLKERFINSDPPRKEELQELFGHIESVFTHFLCVKNKRDDFFLIGTAGTITTLAAIDQKLKVYDPGRINLYVLKRKRLDDIFYKFFLQTKTEWLKQLKSSIIEKGREDIIIPGTAVLLKLMNFFEKEEISVSDYGLLEGILLDYSYKRGANPNISDSPGVHIQDV